MWAHTFVTGVFVCSVVMSWAILSEYPPCCFQVLARAPTYPCVSHIRAGSAFGPLHWLMDLGCLGILCLLRGSLWLQVKLLLPKFHRNRTRKYNNTALFVGGCWVSLIGRFHRHSAAGWAECTVAGPGRARRHAAQFYERSPTPLIGHARLALFEVPTRLLSIQTNDAQRGGKGHKLLPTSYLPYLIRKVSKKNRKRR